MDPAQNTLLVLGATSGLAQSYVRLVATENRFDRYILVARNGEKLAVLRDDVAARSGKEAVSIMGELAEPSAVSVIMADIAAQGGAISECFLAYGVLGDQEDFEQDANALNTMLNTNFVSAVLWMEQMATLFETQGFGRLVTIGSVAGDRGRQSNYLYGATKAGLERVSEGMSHRFAGTKDISMTIVKPGFMDTPMTDHLTKSGPLWAKPEDVARNILKAVKDKRVRIYTPFFWRWILLIVRSLPVFIFHKTKI